MFCEFAPVNTVKMHVLPEFHPTDYLFNEYAKTLENHEKLEKWEIYANAVNEMLRH